MCEKHKKSATLDFTGAAVLYLLARAGFHSSVISRRGQPNPAPIFTNNKPTSVFVKNQKNQESFTLLVPMGVCDSDEVY